MEKRVYAFAEGNADMRALLGGKGANLAEMTRIGLPVPPGFTITTETCMAYLAQNNALPGDVMPQVKAALKSVESQVEKIFGDTRNPLLVSVRSGAKFSMPGMMETILNIGLNDETLVGLTAQTGDERFALDSYRRLISMLGSVVFDIEKEVFEAVLTAARTSAEVTTDAQLTAEDLRPVLADYKRLFEEHAGRAFPQDPMEQMQLAIEAVFRSWNIPRAITYRNYNKIDHTLGTAVNIQAMVFGNMGSDSATGVAFTRNPSTGEKELFGEYLTNAQGEDVVAGIRTPNKLFEMAQELPRAYDTLTQIAGQLEGHFQDMQDLEFTIERGKLYMLQTRSGKRTVQAATKIAVDMVNEGRINKHEALMRVDASQVYQMLLPTFSPSAKAQARNENRLLATGISASPGAATGTICFDPDEAQTLAAEGKDVILVRPETCPDDVHGMIAANGILTSRGGNTSHAAVVARGMGKACIVGCESCHINLKEGTLKSGGKTLVAGELISIDGASGEVFLGAIETVPPQLNAEFETLMIWADETRRLGIRANADTPEDAVRSRGWGAQGIGLCRTEHMFMAQDRLPVVQEMILADTEAARSDALERLLPMQQQDFEEIFRAMQGLPVTIRLLDPPLHEFLPNYDEILKDVLMLECSRETGPELQHKLAELTKVGELREANPMMGFRGCRIGLIYPEIYAMQMKAIINAAITLKKQNIPIYPEIMIPLVGHVSELAKIKTDLTRLADSLMKGHGVTVPYLFGTMIEIPRAALTADEIAREAEFFSFGTNDLTQMTFGFSRDDAEGKFLSKYLDQGIFADNPFEVLDEEGVGKLMQTACKLAHQTRPDIHLGVCGEHGGEPRSIDFCHRIGLDYVSCSPFRVPVARLAAAQAAIRQSSGCGNTKKVLTTI